MNTRTDPPARTIAKMVAVFAGMGGNVGRGWPGLVLEVEGVECIWVGVFDGVVVETPGVDYDGAVCGDGHAVYCGFCGC